MLSTVAASDYIPPSAPVPLETVPYVNSGAFAQANSAGLSAWTHELPDPWSSAQRELEEYGAEMRRTKPEDYAKVCLSRATRLAWAARRLPKNDFLDPDMFSPASGVIPKGKALMCDHLLRSAEAIFRVEAFLAPAPFSAVAGAASAVAGAEAVAAILAHHLEQAPNWRAAERTAFSLAEGLERFSDVMRRLSGVVERSAPRPGTQPLRLEALWSHAQALQTIGRLLASWSSLVQATVSAQDPIFSAAARAGKSGTALEEAAAGLERRADEHKPWFEDQLPEELTAVQNVHDGISRRRPQARSATALILSSGGALERLVAPPPQRKSAREAPTWRQEEAERRFLVDRALTAKPETAATLQPPSASAASLTPGGGSGGAVAVNGLDSAALSPGALAGAGSAAKTSAVVAKVVKTSAREPQVPLSVHAGWEPCVVLGGRSDPGSAIRHKIAAMESKLQGALGEQEDMEESVVDFVEGAFESGDFGASGLRAALHATKPDLGGHGGVAGLDGGDHRLQEAGAGVVVSASGSGQLLVGSAARSGGVSGAASLGASTVNVYSETGTKIAEHRSEVNDRQEDPSLPPPTPSGQPGEGAGGGQGIAPAVAATPAREVAEEKPKGGFGFKNLYGKKK